MEIPMYRLRSFLLLVAVIVAIPALAQDGPEITFLEGDAARAAIVDESVEPYFSLLCLHEMEVKSGQAIEGDTLDEQREAFKVIYAEAVVDFTENEQAFLTEFIGELHEVFAEHYPRLAAYPWSFIKSTRAIEQGLPHTRGHSIVLPGGFLANFIPQYERSPERMGSMLMNLLIHEQMHVVQRLEPETFASFYSEHWGLMHVEKIEYTPWLMERQLINPDGIDVRWVQNVGTEDAPRYIQPNIIIALFGDRPSRMPDDFKMVAVELYEVEEGVWRPVVDAETGLPVYQSIQRESKYRENYGWSGNIYHPNESLADLFATMVVRGRIDAEPGPPGQAFETEQAFVPIRAFMREAFGEVEDE